MAIKWERIIIFDAKGQEWPSQQYVYRTSPVHADVLGEVFKLGPWIISRGKPDDLSMEDTMYLKTEIEAQRERLQWESPSPQIYKTKPYLAESITEKRRRFNTLKDAKAWIEIEASKPRRR